MRLVKDSDPFPRFFLELIVVIVIIVFIRKISGKDLSDSES